MKKPLPYPRLLHDFHGKPSRITVGIRERIPEYKATEEQSRLLNGLRKIRGEFLVSGNLVSVTLPVDDLSKEWLDKNTLSAVLKVLL
jgi:hypothetical protein